MVLFVHRVPRNHHLVKQMLRVGIILLQFLVVARIQLDLGLMVLLLLRETIMMEDVMCLSGEILSLFPQVPDIH